MLVSELKKYAQELFDKGNSQEDIQSLVSKKFKDEDITNEDGSKVDIKEFKLELEEKAVEEQEDIQITVKKAVEKEVKSNKSQKIVLPRVEYVDRPTKVFPDIKLAEAFYAKHVTPQVLNQLHIDRKTITTYSNATTDADGASALKTQVQGVMADIVARYDTAAEKCLNVPMGNSKVATFVARAGLLAGSFVAENTAGTDVKLNMATKTLTSKKIIVPAPVSNDLLRFAQNYQVADEIALGIGRGIAAKRAWALWGADGTDDATDGAFTSIPRTINAVSNNKSIYTINDDWDGLTIGGIISAMALLDPMYTDWSNFAFYGSRAMWGVCQARAIAEEQSWGVITGTKPGYSLLGYPFIIVDYMDQSHTDDSVGLVMGDLKSACAVGAPEFGDEISVHPDTYASVDVTLFNGIAYHAQTVFNPGTSSVVGGAVVVRFNSAS